MKEHRNSVRQSRQLPRDSIERTCELPDAAWRRKLRQRIRVWYRKSARDLPWRRTNDPYAIWVSETMLQQTQVATVEGYFQRFMRRFPTIDSLALATEREVLRLWEGLGYYRRARQLHSAARQIAKHHAGSFPSDFESVIALPGIGRYTAGAVLSIAYDQRQPILEANTIRVYSRLIGYQEDPTRSAGQNLLWRFAESILPKHDVGSLNQAMMELGSEICKPQEPDCPACPLSSLCAANQRGLHHQIPKPKKPTEYKDIHEVAIVLWNRRRQFLLRRCPEGERWAGLWDFPRFAMNGAKSPRQIESQIVRQLRDCAGLGAEDLRKLTTLNHGVTRFRITLDCYQGRVVPGTRRSRGYGPTQWVSRTAIKEFPLSVTGRKIGNLLRGPESLK